MKKEPMIRIWFLHGNLQKPSVWLPVFSNILLLKDNYYIDDIEFIHENLINSDHKSFEHWVCDFYSKKIKTDNIPNFLVGYSLGGRLALHLLIKNPDMWTGVIIIGADTGFDNEGDCRKQYEYDQYWANRFLNEPWKKILLEWDQLPVFCNIPCTITRKEDDFSRLEVAHIFKVFSKGNQKNLLPYLKKLKQPKMLYLSGSEDKKYYRIGKKIDLSCEIASHKTISHSGHRVPWENTKLFSKSVLDFISKTLNEK